MCRWTARCNSRFARGVTDMNENNEKLLAGILADVMDGKTGPETEKASSDKDFSEALEAAGLLAEGLAEAPPMNEVFDRRLRRLLVAETGKQAKTAPPFYRRPWFKAAYSAALFLLVLAPYWFYMRPLELRDTYKIKQLKEERLEKYDKMYVPKLAKLRETLKTDVEDKLITQNQDKRRETRIQEILDRRRVEQAQAAQTVLKDTPGRGGQ